LLRSAARRIDDARLFAGLDWSKLWWHGPGGNGKGGGAIQPKPKLG
jgi:hypothetical protein